MKFLRKKAYKSYFSIVLHYAKLKAWNFLKCTLLLVSRMDPDLHPYFADLKTCQPWKLDWLAYKLVGANERFSTNIQMYVLKHT